ncbi:MAG TPA: MFS transporter [Solirubrobacteraceae bacterium]|nr:MFS transporter [Solirubrobacteraceae bacterium]
MIGRYRPLVAVPGFPRLLLSAVAGRMPLGMASLSILLTLRASTHSFATAGIAVGGFAVAQATMSPLAGGMIDRFGMRRVLLPCAAVQATALTVLVAASDAHASSAVLVVLAAASGASMPPVSACSRMLWPRVTPDRATRDAAYALDSIAQEIVWTTGPLVVGAIAGLASPRLAVLTAAAVSLVGTTLFATAPATRRVHRGRGGGALRAVLQCRPLQILFMVDLLLGLQLGVVEVGLPALAIHEGSHGAAGILLSLWSIGSLVGGLLYGARHWGSSSERQLAMLLLGSAAVTVPLAIAWDLPSAFVLAAIAGVCGAPLFSRLYSLVGDHAPESATGTAFSWNTAALVAGIAGGSALAGISVSDLGVRAPFLLSAGFGAVAAAMTVAAGARLSVRPICAPQCPAT